VLARQPVPNELWRELPHATPVGMDGYVDLSSNSYAGTITSAGCGVFSVSR
jgi:hypothetical protein